MSILQHLNTPIDNVRLETKSYQDREHLVVPVVMLTEGVHCGSGGCFLYTAEHLRQFPAAWNNRPLPVFHPSDESGVPISANSPEVIEEHSVGSVFNVIYDAQGRVAGELWIDVLRAEEKSPDVLKLIRSGGRLEVSTGFFSETDEVAGTWQGAQYEGTIQNIRPDHLALLPGGKGACSWDDGCGVRNMEITINTGAKEVQKLALKKFEYLGVIIALRKDQMPHEDVRQQLQKHVDTLDVIRQEFGISTMHFVMAVYDSYYVYRKEGPNGVELFKQNYSMDSDNKVQINEEVIEVKEQISYVATQNNEDVNLNKEGGKETMANTEKCCPKKVQALIDNEDSLFVEADREFLSNLTEEQLDKVEPVIKEVSIVNEEDEEAKKEAAEALKAQAEKDVKDNIKVEDILDESQLEALEHGKTDLKIKKDAFVRSLLDNSNNKFSKQELEGKKVPELQKLAELSQTKVNYGGNGGSATVENTDGAGEVLEMETIEFKK